MSENQTVFETVRPRRHIEKRISNVPERPARNKVKLYYVSHDRISSEVRPTTTVYKRTGGPVTFKQKHCIIKSGYDVFQESQLLQHLIEKIFSDHGDDTDSDINHNKADTCHAESRGETHMILTTVSGDNSDVAVTSHELVGFVNINGAKHSEYSYSFMSHDESQEPPEQSTPETVLKMTFRKCPDNFRCTRPVSADDVIYRSSPREKESAKTNTSSKEHPFVGINEDVLALLIHITLNDFSGKLYNYKPVELSTRANAILCHLPYLSITPQNSGIQENLENTSFITSLFSFLTWPQDASASPFDLVRSGFTRDDHGDMYVKCLSCGLVIDSTEFDEKDCASFHRKCNPECKSSIGDALSTKEKEREPDQTYDENDNSLRTPESHSLTVNPDDSVPSLSALCLSSGPEAGDILSNRPRSSLDHTEYQAEALEITPSTHSDITSESDLLGTASGGVDQLTYSPRNPRYTSPDSRRLSFSTWTRPHTTIDIIVDSGFFFTGDEDIVRCFHCDIGLAEWSPDDDPWVEHARHSPDCPFLRSRKDDQFINNIQLQWAQIYTPKHPHMDTTGKREESFNTSWPRDFVLQTPRQLAEAGFFYIGVTDTVRCHYCDAGLREWEPNDEPWTEHARWFPFCKFVIKIKGLQLIQDSAVPEDVADGHANLPPAVAHRIVLAPTFEDECRKRELKNPMFSAAAESALSIGYSKTTVKETIMIYIERTGRRDCTAENLVEIAFELEEQGRAFFSEDTDIITEEEEFELTPKAMKMENVYLKEKLLCVTCKERERCMLFIPCGHRITCGICSKEHKTCPTCLSEVTKTVKTFLG